MPPRRRRRMPPRCGDESWPGLVLEQRLERRERAFPADANYFVIAPPARRLLETALHDVHVRGTARLRSQGDLQRHRSDGIAIRRKPERVCDEKALADLTFHDRAPEDAAEAAEDVVVEIGRWPLNRVDAERPRRRHRMRRLPPGVKRLVVEERFHDPAGRRGDHRGHVELGWSHHFYRRTRRDRLLPVDRPGASRAWSRAAV